MRMNLLFETAKSWTVLLKCLNNGYSLSPKFLTNAQISVRMSIVFAQHKILCTKHAVQLSFSQSQAL